MKHSINVRSISVWELICWVDNIQVLRAFPPKQTGIFWSCLMLMNSESEFNDGIEYHLTHISDKHLTFKTIWRHKSTDFLVCCHSPPTEEMSQSKGAINSCQQLVYITQWFTEMSEMQSQDFMKYLLNKYAKSGQQMDNQLVNGFSRMGIVLFCHLSDTSFVDKSFDVKIRAVPLEGQVF